MMNKTTLNHTSQAMLAKLPNDLFKIIEALLPEWKKMPYWKNRFTQDVIPNLNKGFRLVGFWQNHIQDGILNGCANCYHYGNGYLCPDCEDDSNIVLGHMSYAEFQDACFAPTLWKYEVFNNLRTTYFGRNRFNTCWRNGPEPDSMVLDIHRSRLFRNMFGKKEKMDVDSILPSIANLFE